LSGAMTMTMMIRSRMSWITINDKRANEDTDYCAHRDLQADRAIHNTRARKKDAVFMTASCAIEAITDTTIEHAGVDMDDKTSGPVRYENCR
jgi:hypothetical protein